MKPFNPPSTEYAFSYKKPPVSGNEINGLGVKEKVRAKHVFHDPGGKQLAWHAMDQFFSYITSWNILKQIMANVWQLRKQDGPINENQVAVDDLDKMADDIKYRAARLGAELVGITDISADAVYDKHEVPYKYAICIGQSMDRKEMGFVPQERAGVEVMRSYRKLSKIAIELSAFIRNMGWPAKAYGNPNSTDLLHIPLAIKAGLGQLGKHGSLISKEFGSNFRLTTVTTDLPLALDQPVDLLVDDLCYRCQRCVIDCPPDALSNEKQLVRGNNKWYVNFDKCIPYFVKTYGCAICIEVCPWSEPGKGSVIFEQLLNKRDRTSAR
ncbi:MAG: 4Fe-4S dicluster domain-containing protein [Candidatus Neomarinimicrobiota bacterium]